MSIVEVNTFLEADHALVFLKTDDGEVHALEFGAHHEEEAKHNHHDKLHDKHAEKHSQGHKKHDEKSEEHATHAHKHEAYGVHIWSPIGSRPGETKPPATWTKVDNKTYTPETLNHELKHEWHHHAATEHAFNDPKSFINHLLVDKFKC
jgi:hypothetical protein